MNKKISLFIKILGWFGLIISVIGIFVIRLKFNEDWDASWVEIFSYENIVETLFVVVLLVIVGFVYMKLTDEDE